MILSVRVHSDFSPVTEQDVRNMSLSTSHMLEKIKDAIVSPIIKKSLMDSEILKNFRPVSNLVFICKLIEKVVANLIDVYKDVNKLSMHAVCISQGT